MSYVLSNRSLGAGAAWGVLGRMVAAGTSLALVPLADRALEREAFGVFLLVWSFVAFTTFADFGAGSAIVSRLAGARAPEQRTEATTAGLTVAALASALVAAIAGLLIALPFVGHLARTPGAEALLRHALLLVAVALVPNVTLGLSLRVLQGVHRSDDAGRCVALGNIGQLACAFLAYATGAGPLVFVGVALASQLFAGACATTLVLRDPFLRPRSSALRWATVRSLVGAGAIFAAIGLTGTVGMESDAAIVSWGLGVRAVPAYAVPARMFALVPAVAGVAIAPFWPAVAALRAEGRGVAVVALLRRTATVTAVAAATVSVLLAALLPAALSLIAPSVAAPSWKFRAVLIAWSSVQSASAAYAAVLSGMDLIRPQLVAAALMAVVSAALSVLWIGRIGITGPPLATVITQVLIVLVPMHQLIHRRIRAEVP